MRMSKLAEESSRPVATIKYYLREGLLHDGDKSGPNQATYDQSHLLRLALIRALTVVGGLSVAATKDVIGAIESDLSLPEVFEIAQRSVSPAGERPESDRFGRVDGLIAGLSCTDDNPGRSVAADVLASFEDSGLAVSEDWLRSYLEAALVVAGADLAEVAAQEGREMQTGMVVVGTVLGDRLFAALRRLAQQHVTAERFSGD